MNPIWRSYFSDGLVQPTTNQLVYQRGPGPSNGAIIFSGFLTGSTGWSQRMSSCAEWLHRIALLGVSLIVLILMGSMSCKKGWVYRFLLEQIMKTTIFCYQFFWGPSFLQLGRLLVQKGAPDFLQFLETKWMAQEAELDACCTVGILVVGTCSTSNKRQIPNLCAHSQFFGCFFGGGRGRGKHKESSVWCWDLALRRDSRPGPDSRMSHPGCFFFHGIPRRNLG